MLRSIRGRATLLGTLVVAAVLLASVAALAVVLRANLRSSLDATLTQQVDDRVRLLEGGADPGSLAQVETREAFVAIVRNGELVAASGVAGVPAGCQPTPCDTTVQILESDGEVEGHSVRLVAGAGAGYQVFAGSEAEEISNTVRTATVAALAGLPLVLAVVAVLIWRTVGRVLAPVAAIRKETEELSAGTIGTQRVPEPGTGDEIDGLAQTMNAMLDRLAADADFQRRFASDASHELKSPLANMRALIDTSNSAGDNWEQLRGDLLPELDRMAGIVDDLLYLAVADEGGLASIETKRLHIDDLVFDEMETAGRRPGVALRAGDISPTAMRGDEAGLRRLMRNLLENGVRHASSLVQISVSSSGDRVQLVVEDDGPGIPEADRESVFERFMRADSSRSRDSGSAGLGLSIVSSIAAAHGGSATVTESPLGGARFVVDVAANL